MGWTESSLRSHLKNMTNGTKLITQHISNKPVNTTFDDDMLECLMKFHPMYERKSLDKLRCFEVRKPPPYYGNTLYFHTLDGQFDDVSYKMCIQNLFGKFDMTKMIRQEVIYAFRDAIFNDSNERYRVYKENIKNPICDNCKDVCCTFHIDHHGKPFSQLLDDFLDFVKLKLSDVEIHHNALQTYEIKDDAVRYNWVLYHDKHASLRVLCKRCNLSFGAYGYKSKN